MLGGLLTLLKACLNFDFIGTSYDDSDDDFGTIHIPTQWKECMCLLTLLWLLFFTIMNHRQKKTVNKEIMILKNFCSSK